MSTPRVAVVTGSNKGIGLAIVRLLVQKDANLVVYLTARNVDLGEQACLTLKAQLGGGGDRLRFHQLDITDKKSCEALRDDLKRDHGGLDVLVNNAGIAYKAASTASAAEQAKVTNDTNYFGLRNVCDALFTILNKNARVVNMQSRAGLLTDKYGEELKTRLLSDSLTVDALDGVVREFVERASTVGLGDGWPTTTYGFSKAAGIALTRIHHRQLTALNTNILINAVCPGYVDTDMSSHKGPLTVDEGAQTPIWLATLAEGAKEPNGQFCFDMKVGQWVGNWQM